MLCYSTLGTSLKLAEDLLLNECVHVSRHMKEAKNAFDTEHPLHTFSIGIQGSPDLLAARKVADFLGTEHHEFTFTVDEGIDALYDLIWHIESYEQVRVMRPSSHAEFACTPPSKWGARLQTATAQSVVLHTATTEVTAGHRLCIQVPQQSGCHGFPC